MGVDGRLCAAAFVQDRHAYTGCTSVRDPSGASGRAWCYVQPQVVDGTTSSWNYCASVPDYDAMRAASADAVAGDLASAQRLVARLQRAQSATEAALQLYHEKCGSQ